MNVTLYNTRNYERKRDWTLGENKPNSNPNKPNLKRAKMNVNLYVIEDYRKKDDFVVRIKNAFLQKDYENETAFRPKKNKPNSNPILSAVGGFRKAKIACRKIRPHPQVANGSNNFDFCL